jgi:hypothetical protein
VSVPSSGLALFTPSSSPASECVHTGPHLGTKEGGGNTRLPVRWGGGGANSDEKAWDSVYNVLSGVVLYKGKQYAKTRRPRKTPKFLVHGSVSQLMEAGG